MPALPSAIAVLTQGTQHVELTDKRVELSKIHNGPHQVAADECE